MYILTVDILFQDRVLINRLDNLCTLVVTGQWPSGRRYIPEAQLNPSSELLGEDMAYTRVIRKPSSTPGGIGAEGEDGEFTVKLLKVTSERKTIHLSQKQPLLNFCFTNRLIINTHFNNHK